MIFAPFADEAVEAKFRSLPESLRSPMLRLRQMILDVAAGSPDIGPLTETLKWGEPAWLPERPGTGTTVRADALKGSATHYALYVHCQTSLIETFRRHYPAQFSYEGNRALIFAAGSEPLAEPLAHCIALALTYHRWARR
ncbi:DUF1801 domain-containing protein [Boseaceae bacterium BT-24-1]|nr:DUF1801 domain-containing protein [Boseaceae bacterium BT-24-1]